MNCYIHKDKTAGNTCTSCGSPICEDCLVNVKGRILCKSCVEKIARSAPPVGVGHTAPPPPGVGHTAPPPPRPYEVVNRPPYDSFGGPRRTKDVNGFFLFCLSAIPGLNYMYMGLMKKGLLFMSGFFLSIYLANYNFPFMGFITFMIMCTSFFDGFSVRRRILSGEMVEDNIDDVLLFVQRHKGLLIIAAAGIFGLGMLGKLRRIFLGLSNRIFGYGLGWEIFDMVSNIFSIAVIALGIYIIYRAFTRRTDRDNKDNKNM